VRAVKQPPPPPADADNEDSGVLPVGKLVAPPATKPPAAPHEADEMSLDFGSFDAPAAPSRGAAAAYSPVMRGRRKDALPGMWIGVGIGAVVVAGLVVVLLVRGNGDKTADASHASKAADKAADADKPAGAAAGEKSTDASNAADKSAGEKEKPADKSADKPAENEKAADKSSPDKAASTNPAVSAAADKDKTGNKSSDPSAGKAPGDKKPSRPAHRPGNKPTATEEMPVTQQYRGIEEVAKADAPEALKKFVTESAASLKNGEFEKFFENDVDPRDRGTLPAATPARWSPDDLPYDVLAQGKLRVTAMFAMLATQQPRMFEEGKIAVYDLSPRTKPTFVLHEGRWYLSRGLATAMEKRFRTLTDQEQLVYLLETATGAKAAHCSDPMFTGQKKEIANQLEQQGVIVAILNPEEQRKGCAVRLTRKFSSGNTGLYTLPALNNVSPIVVLVIDEIVNYAKDDTEETYLDESGLQALASLTSVEYLSYNGVPTSETSVLLHFQDMAKLRRVFINGGALDDGEAITSDLDKTTDMNVFTLCLDQPTESILNAFKKYPTLHSLTLQSRRKTAVSDEAVASLREAMPGLWVDY
jgi:hypothetical protein